MSSFANIAQPTATLDFRAGFPAPPIEQLQDTRLNSLMALWTRLVGPINHKPHRDYEEFVEQLFRLDAAVQAFGEQHCTVGPAGGGTDFVWGPIGSWGSSHGADVEPADTYWDIPAFRKFSGRRWALAGLVPDAGPGHLEVIARLHGQGVREFLVKGTDSKSMLVRFSLGDKYSTSDIPSDIYFGAMHREGQAKVYLVQEAIPMVDEYRLFMVGSDPATGAGCIEDFTPLDNRGDAFDPRVNGVRGQDPTRTDQGRVAELIEFGRAAGAALFADAPDLGPAWVMDVAMAPTGPVVIELNGARNSGLYASRPETWLSASKAFITTKLLLARTRNERASLN